MPTASSGTTSIDPFERTRLNNFRNIFHKGPVYPSQWHIDHLKKLGYNLGYLKKYLNSKLPVCSQIINRDWPRDPEGKHHYLTDTLLQTATPLDFFFFIPTPFLNDLERLGATSIGTLCSNVGVATGSMLSAWVKANGELEYATSEMAWAEAEEKPKLRFAADIMEIINARDLMIIMEACGTSMRGDVNESGEESHNTQKKVPTFFVFPWLIHL
ncbi:hypothetical protein BT96DRAFT_312861 [Gymnopus androsaceus JB14]|uniref:Uncharacterized protein n=1 Tax=Gymnopus androsaceus JB14 TaxID=1447944 RepID=A0A6A4I992_9AGAR|nr:hypothetical protein BT96DRAFT_312861 [Gymnopus androsaceus JB14]